jgi:hypothetical protein
LQKINEILYILSKCSGFKEGITAMDKNDLLFFYIIISLSLCLSFFLAGCTGKTPGKIFVISDHLPRVDGTINPDEYSMTIETEKMTLHLSRNNNNLFFGLTGRTMGWTSIGFGGIGMDKAHIIIGYAQDGSHVVQEHTGKGHTHTPSPEKIILSSNIRDHEGSTTFEGSVKAGELITPDQKILSLIIACGDADNFSSRHIFRKSLVIKLTGD